MSNDDHANRLAAEARARVLIDRQLADAGWSVQDKKAMNLFAAQGVAVREVTLKPGHGRADYLLYVDQTVVGVIEAKPEGTPLSGVEWQSSEYAYGLPADVRLATLTKDGRLPFVFEASGTETHFTNGYDPDSRARRIFNVPKPSTLAGILKAKNDEHPTWRGKVRDLPPLGTGPLRPAQIEAINGVRIQVFCLRQSLPTGRGPRNTQLRRPQSIPPQSRHYWARSSAHSPAMLAMSIRWSGRS